MLTVLCLPAATSRLRRCVAGLLLPCRPGRTRRLACLEPGCRNTDTGAVVLGPVTAVDLATAPANAASRQSDDTSTDKRFMRMALEQAAAAAAADEVPVGAVLVSKSGEVLAAACNATEASCDPTAHAELLCIRQAAGRANGWRMLDATLYVTLEPCPMCAGALLQARVGTVVYGARNTLLGADGSWIAMLPQSADCQGSSGSSSSSDRNSIGSVGSSSDGSSSAQGTISCSSNSLPDGSAAAAAAAADGSATAELPVVAPCKPHPFHPNMKVRRGVLADECATLMRAFFSRRRKEAAAAKRVAM